MRKYSVGPDGEIRFEGNGGGVALRTPATASSVQIAELLQQTWDDGYQAALLDVCARVGDMMHGMPPEAASTVRSNTRPSTEEAWNKR